MSNNEIIEYLYDWIFRTKPTLKEIDDRCFQYLNDHTIDSIERLDYIRMRAYAYMIINCETTKTIPVTGY